MKKLFGLIGTAEPKNQARDEQCCGDDCCGGGAAMTSTDSRSVVEAVQEHYTKVAERGRSAGQGGATASECCGSSANYTTDQLEAITAEAAGASAGCGNPIGLAEARVGETVLDLGSGGGIDCFLAAKAVGSEGRVIGVDMTHEMVALARDNAAKLGTENVTFKLAQIESIPEPDDTIDLVISNCVIALAPDKDRVFEDVFRVLKPGARFVISDMVVEQELPEHVRRDAAEWVSCVGGADVKSRYLGRIERAGFERIELLEDRPMSPGETGQVWRGSVRSVTVRAFKPAG